MLTRIALVTSDVFVRRLTPALAAFVKERRDFRIIDIARPWKELRAIIRECRPGAIITEVWPALTEKIVALGYPTVVADTDRLFPGAVSIDVDDWAVGATAATFFIESGFRSFACVSLRTPYGKQRLEGFEKTLRQSNFSCRQYEHATPVSGHYMESWRSREAALIRWLNLLPKPVGVFAVHDPLGRTVCEVATEAGLQVPEEIAVVGANNDELVCGLSFPPLSSVAVPWDRIGSLSGRFAQSLINGEKAPLHPILVKPGPVEVRASSGWGMAVEDPLLRRTLQYMRTRASSGATVASICKDLRVDRRGIERRFAATLKCAPSEMLCRLRVQSAKRLLVQTDLPMALIAEQSGFGSAESFSVIFKKRECLSPSDFRKDALGKR